VVYYDNIGATYVSRNLVSHSRMKHLAVPYYAALVFMTFHLRNSLIS